MERRELIRRSLDAFLAGSSKTIISRATERFRSQLTEALVDGTIFSIIESLRDLQVLLRYILYLVCQY